MIHDEIAGAISAHGAWKQKLRSAIDTGKSESTPEKVCKDNNCSFGKWLYERIDPNEKKSPHYENARQLHAKFHVVAAGVLKAALAGEKENANKMIGLGGEFASVSGQLTNEMTKWKNSLPK